MEFSRFDPSHAERIATWPADAVECLAWCSVERVSGADITAWSAGVTSDDAGDADVTGVIGEPAIEAWVLADHGVPVAYGEVWFDDDEDEAGWRT